MRITWSLTEDSVVQDLNIDRTSNESYLGNIYKGVVTNVEPSIGASPRSARARAAGR